MIGLWALAGAAVIGAVIVWYARALRRKDRDLRMAQAQLRDSEQRFSRFLDHSPLPAWIVDRDGHITWSSRGFREGKLSNDAETVRFFIVRAHYRSALNYSDAHLDDARQALKRLYTALSLVAPADVATINWADPYAARFKAAMDEDFGTPEAVAVLFDLAGEVNKTRSAALAGLLKALGGCLGILQGDPKAFLQAGASGVDEADIQAQIAARAAAKAAKNFAEADRIRQALLAQGIVLKDSAAGTTWEAAQ